MGLFPRSTPRVPEHDVDIQLSRILDAVAEPVWVVDHDGLVTLVNPAAVEVLGYDDASELVGRHGHATVHFRHRDGSPYPAEDCPIRRTLLDGETVRLEEDWFIRRDGSMFPVAFTATPLDTRRGRGAVVAFSDIERRREAEEVMRERDAMLARVAQPVCVVDGCGRFYYVNPAAVASLGYATAAELLDRPAHETVHHKHPDGTPYPAEDCPLTQARFDATTIQQPEDWLVRKDGSMLPVSFTSAPFDTPAGGGAVVVFTDLEERRRFERTTRERDVAQAREAELRAARRRIIEAADAARAQLERDLHDGAQQQFVSAVLDLELAERLEASEPERARELRGLAIDLARTGVADLRDLAAGLHPAILTDRGLGPAVQALTARLAVPVDVRRLPGERLAPAVEASVFFFVSEALTNVVKHADAHVATVDVQAADGTLVVEVADDGRGGATTEGGTGLAGLCDRIGALDGELTVTSPRRGGTTLRAEIPLGRA
jgi:PAS domain S-box-containing protein